MTAEPLSRTQASDASAVSVRALVGARLSPAARIGHVMLFLAAAAMVVGMGSLWATEPSLLLRTHVAFGAVVAIGLAWTWYAVWALTTRHVLLGRHRVVAGRMAVAFTLLFAAGSGYAAVSTGHPAGALAFVAALVMLGVAVGLLVRARREVTRLTARGREIERAQGRRLKGGA